MSRQSSAARTSFRPIGLPRPLEVRTDSDGFPRFVVRSATRGRRASDAPVESIEEVWRVAEAWWREASQARTYYRVILEGGRPFTLFRDDLTARWFEQPYAEATT